MKFHKSILMIAILLLISCQKRKQAPFKVWLCYGDGGAATALNGQVKDLIITGDEDTINYFKAHFDENGDLKYTESRDLDEWEDSSGKHSKINIKKMQYSTLYDDSGYKIAITGIYLGDTTYKLKWEFDKSGRVIELTSQTVGTPNITSPYKYNNKGELIEYTYVHGDHIEPDVIKYKYDVNHRMTEYSLYNENLLLFKTNIQYLLFDSNKNWTQCISTWRSFPPMNVSCRTFKTTRKINYY